MAIFRKYSVKEDFFDIWTHEMAYILGFITADGNVSKYSLRVEIQKKDMDVLNFILKNISPDSNIKTTTKKGKQYKKITINTKKLINSLKKFKVVPNKTKSIRANFDIPKKFIGDYIRGIFDGDGWVYLRRNSIESGIVASNKTFLDDLRRMIAPTDTRFDRIRKRVKITKSGKLSACWMWELGKGASLILRDLMYQNECFSLKRKKELFFSNFYVPSPKLWTDLQIKFLINSFKPKTKGLLNYIAEKLGKSRKAVSKKIWELELCN
jgi:hypothetical protein